jgi:cold shock CspA family protein
MNERSRLVALLVLSVAVAGLLTWAVVGPRRERCTTIVLGQRLTKEQAQTLDKVFSDSMKTCGSFLSGAAFPSTSDSDVRKPVERGPVHGSVVAWHDELGWGVLASPSVKGEVWAHFSSIGGKGYRVLVPGQAVTFTYETPGQDGFPHRAVSVIP